MTNEQILEIYPGPWSFYDHRGKVELVDYNGNPVATIYGETLGEAKALAALLCKLPDAVTLSTI